MKNLLLTFGVLLVSVPAASAQLAAPASSAEPATAVVQPTRTLRSFLGFSCDKNCKRETCKTPLTQYVTETPPVSLVESIAAKIKADEAGAKDRRAAIRYLGTVDGHYFPEAEVALIAGLRADRNEQVRLEAAQTLGSGHYTTPKVLEALALVVSSGDKDGNPAETSERVRSAAMIAYQKCLAKGVDLPAVVAEAQPQTSDETMPELASFTERRPQPSSSATAAERLFAETVSAPRTPVSAPAPAQRPLAHVPSELPAAPRHFPSIPGLRPLGTIPGE